MSFIQKLRDKYAKLTGGIIVVALLGFIFMDLGRGNRGGSTTVGKVNGQKINVNEYDDLLQRTEDQIKAQSPGQTLSADQEARLRDQIWQQVVTDHLLEDMNNKLGVQITDAEINNLLTDPNPGPIVREELGDPQTGKYSPQQAAVEIQQKKNDPTQREEWNSFMSTLKTAHLNEKMASLLTGAIYIPKFVLDEQISNLSEVANVQFVKIPFSTVPDKEADVTDADINKYIQAHPNRFKVPKTTRSIEYVSFAVAPSHEDSAKVLNVLDTLKTAFATTKDVEGFVNHNSQNPTPPAFFTIEQLKMLPNATELLNGTVNEVIGPFFDGGSYDLARVLDKKMLPDSVRSRHILVAIKEGTRQIRSDSAAKARIDSAIALLNAGTPFSTVAAKFSDDPNSQKNGDAGRTFGLTQKQGLASIFGKDFSDFIFEGKVGESKLLKVDTDNYSAYTYVQILQQAAPVASVKLAFVSLKLAPSDQTNTAIYNTATQFATKSATDHKSFEQNASAFNQKVQNAPGIDQNSYMIDGLGSSRDLVQWIYDKNTKVGDVSSIYSVGNDFVVAKLVGIQEKGLLKITPQNRMMLRSIVMKNKKAQIILNKYKTPPASLAAFSQTVQQPVNNLDSVRFIQEFTPGLGNEPKVVGYAFNPDLKLNSVSPAIPGNEGVFFISVLSKNKVTLPAQETNEKVMKQSMMQNLKRSAPQALINSMIQNADVEDLRSSIF